MVPIRSGSAREKFAHHDTGVAEQSLTDWLATNPGWLSAALFLTAFLESLAFAGILIPGVAILFAVAVLAGQVAIPVAEVLLWAGAGAVAGDGISFALGRLFQGRLDRLWPLNRYPGFIGKGEAFLPSSRRQKRRYRTLCGPDTTNHSAHRRRISDAVATVPGLQPRLGRGLGTSLYIAGVSGWQRPGQRIQNHPRTFTLVIGISLAAILTVIYLLLLRFQLRAWAWQPASTNGCRSLMAQYDATHRFWRLYTSQRPAREGEFPLALIDAGAGRRGPVDDLGPTGYRHQPAGCRLMRPTLQWFEQLRTTSAGRPLIILPLRCSVTRRY